MSWRVERGWNTRGSKCIANQNLSTTASLGFPSLSSCARLSCQVRRSCPQLVRFPNDATSEWPDRPNAAGAALRRRVDAIQNWLLITEQSLHRWASLQREPLPSETRRPPAESNPERAGPAPTQKCFHLFKKVLLPQPRERHDFAVKT